jgi:hypothetical protein
MNKNKSKEKLKEEFIEKIEITKIESVGRIDKTDYKSLYEEQIMKNKKLEREIEEIKLKTHEGKKQIRRLKMSEMNLNSKLSKQLIIGKVEYENKEDKAAFVIQRLSQVRKKSKAK